MNKTNWIALTGIRQIDSVMELLLMLLAHIFTWLFNLIQKLVLDLRQDT